MSFWYDKKGRSYASTGGSNWIKQYAEHLVAALQRELSARLSKHASGEEDRHHATDVDYDESRTIQEVFSTREEVAEVEERMVGQKGEAIHAEKFNDYVENKAAVPYAHIEGKNNKAEIRCFIIRGCAHNSVTLTSTEGIEAGMPWRICPVEGYPGKETPTPGIFGIVQSVEGDKVIIEEGSLDPEDFNPSREASYIGTFIVNGGTIGTHVIEDEENINFTTHAEGIDNVASLGSHAEGSKVKALGFASHAEGRKTTTLGDNCHAEGILTTAKSHGSHAEGDGTVAAGKGSHSEGCTTQALAEAAHAEGKRTVAKGISSHAEGEVSQATGKSSHAEGYTTIASGEASHTEGYKTESTETGAHAEGTLAHAYGYASHAEGSETLSIGNSSHAEGHRSEATASQSHAEGYDTRAVGDRSHAEGEGTKASGYAAHAEGIVTVASGRYSHAEGEGTTAATIHAHAEGYGTEASGSSSHAEGSGTKATASQSHAEGYSTTASGLQSHAEGNSTTASGNKAHAEGEGTTASGINAHAEGYTTTAAGGYSHAEGQNTSVGEEGVAAHAEGYGSAANAACSHAEGLNTVASAKNAHAEGNSSKASGENAHAEGKKTEASGISSHAEGESTQASGYASHAEGFATAAQGRYAHTEGEGIIASGNHQHVQGKFNVIDSNNKFAHIVGNGTSNKERSNAHTLDWDGNATFAGKVYAEGDKELATVEQIEKQGIWGGVIDLVPDNVHTVEEVLASPKVAEKTGIGDQSMMQYLIMYDDTAGNYGCPKNAVLTTYPGVAGEHFYGGGDYWQKIEFVDRSEIYLRTGCTSTWYDWEKISAPVILTSSSGSGKKFQLQVDDNGNLTTAEV